MSIERGTIQIVVSARVAHSRAPRYVLAKTFSRWAARLSRSKIVMEELS